MAARNFWCLPSDAGKQCGVIYTFVPQLQKSPQNFLRRNQAVGVLLSNGTSYHGPPRLIICPFLSHTQVLLRRSGNWLATAM